MTPLPCVIWRLLYSFCNGRDLCCWNRSNTVEFETLSNSYLWFWSFTTTNSRADSHCSFSLLLFWVCTFLIMTQYSGILVQMSWMHWNFSSHVHVWIDRSCDTHGPIIRLPLALLSRRETCWFFGLVYSINSNEETCPILLQRSLRKCVCVRVYCWCSCMSNKLMVIYRSVVLCVCVCVCFDSLVENSTGHYFTKHSNEKRAACKPSHLAQTHTHTHTLTNTHTGIQTSFILQKSE